MKQNGIYIYIWLKKSISKYLNNVIGIHFKTLLTLFCFLCFLFCRNNKNQLKMIYINVLTTGLNPRPIKNTILMTTVIEIRNNNKDEKKFQMRSVGFRIISYRLLIKKI